MKLKTLKIITTALIILGTLFFATFFSLFGKNLQADTIDLHSSIGHVVAGKGTFFRNDQLLSLTEKIYEKDSIRTDDQSFLVVETTDGTRITIRPNSEIVFSDYFYSTKNPSFEISVVEGGLRMITGAIAKSNPGSVKINTPVAILGVRGTEFGLMLCGQELCSIESK